MLNWVLVISGLLSLPAAIATLIPVLPNLFKIQTWKFLDWLTWFFLLIAMLSICIHTVSWIVDQRELPFENHRYLMIKPEKGQFQLINGSHVELMSEAEPFRVEVTGQVAGDSFRRLKERLGSGGSIPVFLLVKPLTDGSQDWWPQANPNQAYISVTGEYELVGNLGWTGALAAIMGDLFELRVLVPRDLNRRFKPNSSYGTVDQLEPAYMLSDSLYVTIKRPSGWIPSGTLSSSKQSRLTKQ